MIVWKATDMLFKAVPPLFFFCGDVKKASSLFFCGEASFLGFFALGVLGDDRLRLVAMYRTK